MTVPTVTADASGGALRRLRIDLAYDGAPFAGFARQPDQRTVQGDLEAVLSRLLGQPITTTCAGRTDRGVHARAQVVHCDVDATVSRAAAMLADTDQLASRLDRALDAAITIWAVRRADARFDARFSATWRAYRYRIVDDVAAADPRSRGTYWRVEDTLALAPMRAAAPSLIGEHDFASFCRAAAGRTTVRRIDRITVSRPRTGQVLVALRGTAFCHQQVRAIVGCLVEIGRGRRPPSWLAEVLAARDRSVAARLAPPHGLTLHAVSFGPGRPGAPPDAVRRAVLA